MFNTVELVKVTWRWRWCSRDAAAERLQRQQLSFYSTR